jgi:hypothetical protein
MSLLNFDFASTKRPTFKLSQQTSWIARHVLNRVRRCGLAAMSGEIKQIGATVVTSTHRSGICNIAQLGWGGRGAISSSGFTFASIGEIMRNVRPPAECAKWGCAACSSIAPTIAVATRSRSAWTIGPTSWLFGIEADGKRLFLISNGSDQSRPLTKSAFLVRQVTIY